MSTTSSYTQANRPIRVTTPLGADALLLEAFEGVESISEPFRFRLDLLALASVAVPFDKLLGHPVTITLQMPDGSSRYFNGIAARLSKADREKDDRGGVLFNRFAIEMVPKLWTLSRVAQSRIFQQLSVPDILKQVLAALTVDYSGIQGTYQPRDYCVQYRETDFAFASRLLEEEGIFYFFKHTADAHTLVLADSASAHPEIADAVNYRRDADQVPQGEWIDRWEKSQEVRSGKYTLWDHCFELPGSNLAASQTTPASVQVGAVTHSLQVGGNSGFEIYDYPGAYAQRFDGVDPGGSDQASKLQDIFDDNTRTVGLRMQREAVAGLLVEGGGNSRALAAGSKFTLAGHPDGDGSYVLTRVAHHASAEGSYLTGRATAFDYSNTLRCIPAALPFRPEQATPRPRVSGVQTAKVVGPSGQEIFADKYGRVKVQFFWDRQGQNNADSSCWIRVASAWAGKQWGMVHIPRIGQEVLVDFLEGDPDRPIIVGSVYNGEDMPPYTLPDNITQSGIKSRSSLQGTAENFNELRFEDKKGAEQVVFHAEKDFLRTVENNDSLTVGSSDSETCPDGSQTISIYKDRTESVETGDESVTIKKGSRSHTVSEGDESLTVTKGKRTVTVQADDSHTVKEGNRSVTVSQGNDSTTVSAGNQSTKVTAGTITTQAGQTITLKVGENTIVIDNMGITLTVGENSVKIDMTGVTIQGMNIKATADIQAQVSGVMVQVSGEAMLQLSGGITMIG